MNPRLSPHLGTGDRGGLPPRAKLVATLGPASDPPEMIEKLVAAGVGGVRRNVSPGGRGRDERIGRRRLRRARHVLR